MLSIGLNKNIQIHIISVRYTPVVSVAERVLERKCEKLNLALCGNSMTG
jgi:predicted RNA-binding protein with PIN domain